MKANTTNNTTYAAAEKELISNGYKMEMGMPLTGVRFTNGTNYAFVLRMGDKNYETSYYKAKKQA